MQGESKTLFDENQYRRVQKIVFFITISNSLVIFWDLFGLNQLATPAYIFSKIFFLGTPLLLLGFYKKIKDGHLWIEMLLAIIYFGYSGYYMATVHYSYYTAFMQFCIGLIVFLHFSVKTFLIAYGLGTIFFIFSIQHLATTMEPSRFQFLKPEIIGALLPLLFVSILIFLFIRKKELNERNKDLFFKRIGESVGFLLHEIKQPLRSIQQSPGNEKVEEIEELLLISDLMWPTENSKNEVHFKNHHFKDILQQQISEYQSAIKGLKIQIETHLNNDDSFILKTNRNILRIILKNILKNAIEELANLEIEKRIISIERNQNTLIIKNHKNPKQKISSRDLYKPGYSTKSGVTNKGIGLYICKELAEKINVEIDIKADGHEFRVNLSFPV